MNSRSTWAWVVAAIVLVAAYWISGNRVVEQKRAVYEAKRLFDFSAEEVVRLSISTREDELIEAERVSEDTWQIVKPYEHILPNHGTWSQLASVLPQLINERSIEASPEDLALYGLDDPPLELIIEAAGTLVQLNVGNLDPTQNNRYAQLGSEDVFLLPAPMANVLYQPLMNLRDTRVFPGIDFTIDRIHYKRFAVAEGDAPVEGTEAIDETYIRGEDDRWRMTEPYEAYTFQNEVLHLISQLSYLTGEDYVDSPADAGDFGLNPPWARIEVENSETGVKQTLALGWLDDMAEDGRMFASLVGNPSIFTIDAKMIDFLPDAPGDFREKRLFTQEAIDLTAIHYTDAAGSLTLTNDDTVGWTLTNPAHDDTDAVFVSNFIGFIKNFQATGFPEVDRNKVGNETLRFTFDYRDGAPSTGFTVFGAVPDSDPLLFYAQQDLGDIVTIPYEGLALLRSAPFRFRKKDVFAFNPTLTTTLSVTVDGKRYTLAQNERSWRVIEPPDHGFESQAELAALLGTLPAFRAMDVVDPVPGDDVTGLSTPVLVAEVRSLTADAEVLTQRLEIGNLATEQARIRFARVEGRPEVFYTDHGFIEDIRSALRGIIPLK